MRSLIPSLAIFCASLAVVFGLSLTTAKAAEVTLLGVEKAGGPEIKESINWSIVKVNKETGKPEAKPTFDGKGPRLTTKLEPGQYLVTATLGKIVATQAILVGKSATTRSLVLTDPTKPVAATAAKKADGGPPAQLSINMKLSKGKSPVKEPVKWEVFTYVKGATDESQKVAEKTAPTGTFSLPGGSYVVRAHFQGTEADLVIPIQAGQSLKYTLNLYAGYVKLTALKSKKKNTAKELTWQILRQRPNAPGVYELVTSSAKAEPTVMLREGRYIAVARLGSKLWGSEPIVIVAGETSSKKVNLKEGVGAPEIAAAN